MSNLQTGITRSYTRRWTVRKWLSIFQSNVLHYGWIWGTSTTESASLPTCWLRCESLLYTLYNRLVFSTSVELESDNVCMSVCMSVRKLWGSLQKWSNLAEILHTYSLGEYLGCFFHFFKILIFWAWSRVFALTKKLKQRIGFLEPWDFID